MGPTEVNGNIGWEHHRNEVFLIHLSFETAVSDVKLLNS